MKQITFIDSAEISIKSGDGGNGARAFHREKYVEKGGPSGGDGGNGGSVYFIADNNENTLLNFKSKKNYKAEDGSSGEGRNMTGASGQDLYIKVPLGTQIFENKKMVADLSFNGQKYLAQQGGKGGRGNASFKSSRSLAPELYENGEKIRPITLELNLKVLADVGLLGFPNAGKSTFLSVVSNARPKIADYEFTTLAPNLGSLNHNGIKFTITDLPGLIEGASSGKGMGFQFLKHLSRTKIILHLIDASSEDVKEKYKILRKELKIYSSKLEKLPEIIVLTKIDLLEDQKLKEIKKIFKTKKTFLISSMSHKGVKDLLDYLSLEVDRLRKIEVETIDEIFNQDMVIVKHERDEDNLEIELNNNVFTIYSKYVHYWANRIPYTTYENQLRLLNKFESSGIIKKLKSLGLKNGFFIKVKNSPLIIEYEE